MKQTSCTFSAKEVGQYHANSEPLAPTIHPEGCFTPGPTPGGFVHDASHMTRPWSCPLPFRSRPSHTQHADDASRGSDARLLSLPLKASHAASGRDVQLEKRSVGPPHTGRVVRCVLHKSVARSGNTVRMQAWTRLTFTCRNRV